MSSSRRSTSPSRGSRNTFDRTLQSARSGDTEALGALLQWYSSYLSILAKAQLNDRLRRRLNPSDVVQEALLAASRDFHGFYGATERELLGWLRQILIHCLHRAIETHVKAGKRDLRREVSLDDVTATLDKSARRIGDILAADVPSPSGQIQQHERAVALADELAKLPDAYRDVIVLRNLQGLAFAEIAIRMKRTPEATRMLWLRAIDKFRKTCKHID